MGQLVAALLTADWRVLLLGLPLMALFICCEAGATHSTLRALGCSQPFRRCVSYSCTGFFFSTVTPSATGGQPAQVCAMRRDGVPAASGALDMLLVTIGYDFEPYPELLSGAGGCLRDSGCEAGGAQARGAYPLHILICMGKIYMQKERS